MARKFKVGDKVRVVKFIDPLNKVCGPPDNFKLGNVGKVIEVRSGKLLFPYKVERRNKLWNLFNVRELELVE